MIKKLFSSLILINLTLLVVACGSGRSSSDVKRFSRAPKKVLTEAEKEKYITPTIYFISDYTTAPVCAEKTGVNLKKRNDQVVKVQVCAKVLKGCAMQGSCYINFEGQKTLINYHKKVNGAFQFMIVDQAVCRHGLGDSSDAKQKFKAMCLDPFYSVASDTSIHPLGTVIYIPAVRGTVIPDGSVHDGFFIVRDSGGNIDGRGRFDFFTGDVGLGAGNVFSDLGLGGESNFEYFIVSESEAEVVRQRRAFPFIK